MIGATKGSTVGKAMDAVCLRLHLSNTRTVGEEGTCRPGPRLPGHSPRFCRTADRRRVQSRDRHILVNERDGAMFHFAGRISFGVDMKFPELQRPSSAMG